MKTSQLIFVVAVVVATLQPTSSAPVRYLIPTKPGASAGSSPAAVPPQEPALKGSPLANQGPPDTVPSSPAPLKGSLDTGIREETDPSLQTTAPPGPAVQPQIPQEPQGPLQVTTPTGKDLTPPLQVGGETPLQPPGPQHEISKKVTEPDLNQNKEDMEDGQDGTNEETLKINNEKSSTGDLVDPTIKTDKIEGDGEDNRESPVTTIPENAMRDDDDDVVDDDDDNETKKNQKQKIEENPGEEPLKTTIDQENLPNDIIGDNSADADAGKNGLNQVNKEIEDSNEVADEDAEDLNSKLQKVKDGPVEDLVSPKEPQSGSEEQPIAESVGPVNKIAEDQKLDSSSMNDDIPNQPIVDNSSQTDQKIIDDENGNENKNGDQAKEGTLQQRFGTTPDTMPAQSTLKIFADQIARLRDRINQLEKKPRDASQHSSSLVFHPQEPNTRITPRTFTSFSDHHQRPSSSTNFKLPST
jgi:hypothetical protein